jgi:hypothetical protein
MRHVHHNHGRHTYMHGLPNGDLTRLYSSLCFTAKISTVMERECVIDGDLTEGDESSLSFVLYSSLGN